ncbi:MAG: hypothetical protein HYW07_14590 [Candidatus Latescibacteria bacterium]|nr:hypothetical protein [Candidatus Latescibacterota bacterium]
MHDEQSTKGRVLLVDDEEAVGRLLELWLTEEDYQVRMFSGGAGRCYFQ